jgi:hypothetical protein
MVQCDLLPTAVQLEPLHKAGKQIFELSLLICHDGTIIDGYKRWMIATDRDRAMLLIKSLTLLLEKAMKFEELAKFRPLAEPLIEALRRELNVTVQREALQSAPIA